MPKFRKAPPCARRTSAYSVRSQAVWFPQRRTAELRSADVAEPGANDILVRAGVSLISSGTEMVVYRGEAGENDLMPMYCEGSLAFPIKYGYQVVGTVERAGAGSGYVKGDRVFARHPHQDLFTLRADEGIVKLPEALKDEHAAFFNLTKVALTALLEMPVRLGDVVVVHGLGIIGLILLRLARRTAGRIVGVDPIANRRELAIRYGADAAVEPTAAAGAVEELSRGRGADVSFEVSGAPAALQTAIDVTGANGTIVVVSYFGSRPVALRLAPEFHFRRQRVISTQAAAIPAELEPRWDIRRRSAVVLEELARLPLDDLVSARYPIADVGRAYDRVDTDAANTLGVLLDYGARA
jgi:2-desacetyl-2-hydroxyethyl bacteriochlorophyllide A dehydrogenase